MIQRNRMLEMIIQHVFVLNLSLPMLNDVAKRRFRKDVYCLKRFVADQIWF